MADGPNPIVIFLHVPKTGGLTMRQILARQVPRRASYTPGAFDPWGDRDPDDDHDRERHRRYLRGEGPAPRSNPGADLNARHLRRYEGFPADRRAGVRILMGHFWYGVHEHLSEPSTYITMLRDPVDRVLSTYHHRFTRHALGQSLPEYIEAGRDPGIDNAQTRRLAGGTGSVRWGPCTPDMLDLAQEHLVERFPVVGLTERFDETLLLLRRQFGWDKLSYTRQNVGSGRARVEDLDAATLELIRERNRFDLELHRFAGDRFDARIASHPHLQRDLRVLRARNAVRGRIAAPVEKVGARLALPRRVVRRASRELTELGRR